MKLKPASTVVENKLGQIQSTVKLLRQSGNERWKQIKNITKQQQQQRVQPNSNELDAAAPVWTQRMETLFGPFNDQLRLIKCDNCGILTRETNSKVGVTHKLNCEMLRKSGLIGNRKFGAQFSNHLESNLKRRASSEVSLDSNMPIKKKKKTLIIDYTQSTNGANLSQQSPESNNVNTQNVFNGMTYTPKQIKKALAAAERLEREAERKEKKRLEEEARKAKKLSRVKGPVNVNEQCGVLVPPNDTPCARSLTCKTHSMGAKRSVPGRSAPYDVLLNEWQKKHNPNWGDRKVVTPRVGPGIEPGQSRKKKKESGSNGGGSGGGNNRSNNKTNNRNEQDGINNNANQSTQEESNSNDSNSKDNNKDKTSHSNTQSKTNNSNSKSLGNNGINSSHQLGTSNHKKTNNNVTVSKGDNRTIPEKMSAINQAKLLGEVDEDFYLVIPDISSIKNNKTKQLNNHNREENLPVLQNGVDQDGDTMMKDNNPKNNKEDESNKTFDDDQGLFLN